MGKGGPGSPEAGRQIKSKERVRDFGEVFTAQREVSGMCDLLPEEMYRPEANYLEPCCGEGVIVLEVLRRKFDRCKKRAEFETAALSVWGMDIQSDNVEITIQNVLALCREYFRVSKKLEEGIRTRYILCDSLKVCSLLSMYEGGILIYVGGNERHAGAGLRIYPGQH